jgi:hypothetical protein
MATTVKALNEAFPGVATAYDFVLPSYHWAIARFEAADSRIQTLQTVILAVSTGIPALMKSTGGQQSFTSGWLILALAVAIGGVVLGAVGRLRGRLVLVDPGMLNSRQWLSKPEWTFKRDMLFFAAKHFDRNVATVARKGSVVVWMVALFLVEMVFMSVWVFASPHTT